MAIGGRYALAAVGAATDQGQVRDIDLEAAAALEGVERCHARPGRRWPGPTRPPQRAAVQVAVLGRRQDVELLAPIGAVAVADDAELLEDVERAVDGGGDRARVDRPTALDQLGPGHVAVGRGEDLDEDAPLRRPAQAASAEALRDGLPAGRERRRSGSRCVARRLGAGDDPIDDHRAKYRVDGRDVPQMQQVAISAAPALP